MNSPPLGHLPSTLEAGLSSFNPPAYSHFLRILRRPTEGLREEPIREEIFSVERLEQYAGHLAVELVVGPGPWRKRSLLPAVRKSGAGLRKAYLYLADAVRLKDAVSPAADWLVDNFHVVEDQLRSVQRDLPVDYYVELPKLQAGELGGFPRVYAIALAILAHTDCRLDAETLKRILVAFQKVSPLRMGELWAVPITLRIALVEQLEMLAGRVVHSRQSREEADALADRLLALAARSQTGAEELTQMLSHGLGPPERFDRAFVVQLTRRLRDQDPDVWPAFDWLEKQLVGCQTNTVQVIQLEHHRQAAAQATIGNIITSMRLLSTLDWRELVESVSVVDPILALDPAGVYSGMEFGTRDRYRHAIERIAKRSASSEPEVAQRALTLATAATPAPDLRRGHVGYYLVGDGVTELEEQVGYRAGARERIRRLVLRHPTRFYLGSVVTLTAALLAPIVWEVWRQGGGLAMSLGLGLLASIPASEFALGLLNQRVSAVVPPRQLPRLALGPGIPPESETMVVMPTLLTDLSTVRELVDRLELHYLANPDPHLSFALLTDFADADAETMPLDEALRSEAQGGIDRLNEKHGQTTPRRFFLFHRHRRWNPVERTWMGWERKRGKLLELNRLLRGATDTSYLPQREGAGELPNVTFVITLDSDTQLPRDSARRLIGTISHPLNRATYDPVRRRVTAGYGIVQPRVSVALPSSNRTRFAHIASGNTGLDPYTTAVSDVYQDLFGEGIYTGKGIYDVDVFAQALEGRVPENLVLSHDLFEGSFARAALATDIELFDEYPPDYDSCARRQHRWTRGDWQLTSWLFGSVADAKGRPTRNDLSAITRWKILDNLRRSLLAPASLTWLALAWTVLPGSAGLWTLVAMTLAYFPIGSFASVGTASLGSDAPLWERAQESWAGLVLTVEQIALSVAFVAAQACSQLDAIFRSLYRVAFSKRRLLEWVVASGAKPGSARPTGPLVAAALFAVTAIVRPSALFAAGPLLALWAANPWLKVWLARSGGTAIAPLGEAETQAYREYARRTWRYFESVVGPGDHWLAPDNLQLDPKETVAHRTSPTNIGLQLLATLSAFDLGYLDLGELVGRLERTFETLAKLEGLHGHFFNWYDTQTLAPLEPRYLSTVDSGNLAGHLWTLGQACLALAVKDEGAEAKGAAVAPGAAELPRRLRALALRCEALATGMDFGFLFDSQRKQFVIGYSVAERRRDGSFYDLLASESRLASFVAIAKGDIPQEHWFRLGRQLTRVPGGRALVSWTGSMFEYLMPLLVMRRYSGTLLDETYRAVLSRQIQYGSLRGVPWGVSESAYNARDLQLNYQYGPFGVPGLGLRRGLSDELIISPYSTVLAAMLDPHRALRNLQRLVGLGAYSTCGFFEAIDYTPERLPRGQASVIVQSYMVHHQGMSLVAINNLLNDSIMQRRFHADPRVRATEMLLQERVPAAVAIAQPRAEEVEARRGEPVDSAPRRRSYTDPSQDRPQVQLLSNGTYSVMVTAAGSGYSRCGPLAVTRWSEDATRDHWGQFFYIRDQPSGRCWSSAHQPVGTAADSYEATFADDRVDLVRRDGKITTQTEIVVSSEDNVELRRVSLTNRSGQVRQFDVTSFMEVVLARPEDDQGHLAFSKLFVQTEFVPSAGTLLATRRRRSISEKPVWAFHTVVVEGATTGPVQWETDRAQFIGRGRAANAPAMMARGLSLSGTVGAVLDPIFSLRESIRLAPGETVRLSFATGVAPSRDEALRLADKYHDTHTFAREADIAWTRSQVQLRHLNLDARQANAFQRLAGRVIYADRSLRPRSAQLALNTRTQAGLWTYGISGDLPIIVMSIHDEKDIGLVRELIHGHEYLRLKGLSIDLVILNDRPATYLQPLQDELRRQIRMSGSQALLDKPSGVFIRRTSLIAAEDLLLLQSVARVNLSAQRGTLEQQLEELAAEADLPRALGRTELPKTRPPPAAVQPALEFFNGVGGFGPDHRTYVIVLPEGQATPAPWINVLANENGFGCLVSEVGAGATWSINSRENRLTPWSNDPLSDPAGEALYLRDERTGEVWTPTPQPIREAETYLIRHGQGYTQFEHTSHGIAQDLRIFVPLADRSVDADAKVCLLRLKNLGTTSRSLSVTSFAEWVLGVHRGSSAPMVVTESDPATGALFARSSYNGEFASRVAFAALSVRPESFTCDRREFIGRNRSLGQPAALGRTRLSGKCGAGLDPCAALQAPVVLGPGEERQVVVMLGQAATAEGARAVVRRYQQVGNAETALAEVIHHWDELLGTIEITTPDRALNALANRWLLYQTLSCRLDGRSAFYQSGGAFGFRDQLQDVMALVYSRPARAREQLLRAAGRQFRQGDVQHWWHPPTGRGVRTHCSDDLLWLPFVASFYLEVTGDVSILDEVIPFLDAAELAPGEGDAYARPATADESATLLEHCLRAVDRSLPVGAHGLPLMGSCDWNDGMSEVGSGGTGESIWVAWLLCATLGKVIPWCGTAEQTGRANRYRDAQAALKIALEEHGWDGAWYRRAYFDDGSPLGSAANQDCRIDSIVQSWAVLSGAGEPGRARQAMTAVDERLVNRADQLMPLFDPPFDLGSEEPGYIKGYLPGVRENGGQYTHAAAWAAMAWAGLGDGDRAVEALSILNPINHATTPAGMRRYQVEPYVMAADVYSRPPHVGRGGWTWYTGSSGWMYRAVLESVLGFELRGDRLRLTPCLPTAWPGFELVYRRGATTYAITVSRRPGPSAEKVPQVWLDDALLNGDAIPLVEDGKKHQVRLVIGLH